ncbi:MAG: hypothetical protein E2P01_05350, partial [Acidobacteria bacterium]
MPQDKLWCTVCCTRHRPGRDCPGNLLATGFERHARKFVVAHDNRLEYYGVLIVESGEYWRARIFTYPSMLWSVPGARGRSSSSALPPRKRKHEPSSSCASTVSGGGTRCRTLVKTPRRAGEKEQTRA